MDCFRSSANRKKDKGISKGSRSNRKKSKNPNNYTDNEEMATHDGNKQFLQETLQESDTLTVLRNEELITLSEYSYIV